MPHRRQGRLAAIAFCLPLAASCVPTAADMRPASAADSARPRYDSAFAAADAPTPPLRPQTAPPPERTRAAAPFHLPTGDHAQNERATDCLTAAIYYEARSEGEEGQRAVAQVVLNRVRHRAYPATICGVVYQHTPGRTCQFTFSCDGSTRRRREPAAWAEARRIAQEALAGSVYEPVGLSTHYHTHAVSPGWGRRLARVTMVGAHIFYGGRSSSEQADFARRTSAPQPVARPAATQAERRSRPRRAEPALAPRPAPRRALPEPGFAFADEAFAALPVAEGGAPTDPRPAAALAQN